MQYAINLIYSKRVNLSFCRHQCRVVTRYHMHLQVVQAYDLMIKSSESTSMMGYIVVAPATSNMYGPSQYSTIMTPTLFIYGSKDLKLGKRGSESFSYVPNVETYVIEDGSHSCYIDQPDQFNAKVADFINSL